MGRGRWRGHALQAGPARKPCTPALHARPGGKRQHGAAVDQLRRKQCHAARTPAQRRPAESGREKMFPAIVTSLPRVQRRVRREVQRRVRRDVQLGCGAAPLVVDLFARAAAVVEDVPGRWKVEIQWETALGGIGPGGSGRAAAASLGGVQSGSGCGSGRWAAQAGEGGATAGGRARSWTS